jgi:zinc and cadmium transporter
MVPAGFMTSLSWIVATTLAGGVLSVLAASLFALYAKAVHIPVLISYAVGALLGAVFIELLPHAFQVASSMQSMAATILGGILLFFVLEKLVLWRHCHLEQCEAHDPSVHEHGHSHAAPVTNGGHDHGRSGLMILIGDTFHNFVDGILVAAAFLANTELGIVTALAIIAHEIPQEVGDFLILLHSGYTRRMALALNMLSSVAMVVGGVLAYFALQTVQHWVPPLLGLAAASMLYVAVADLIPGLHRRAELGATAQQVVLIGLGIGTIWLVGELVHAYA